MVERLLLYMGLMETPLIDVMKRKIDPIIT